jgi:hypothetical protein
MKLLQCTMLGVRNSEKKTSLKPNTRARKAQVVLSVISYQLSATAHCTYLFHKSTFPAIHHDNVRSIAIVGNHRRHLVIRVAQRGFGIEYQKVERSRRSNDRGPEQSRAINIAFFPNKTWRTLHSSMHHASCIMHSLGEPIVRDAV